MKESDLYLPLKTYLESQGYEVKGEIHDCDVLAIRGEEAPIVVELKLSFNLNVILQAVERLSLTANVYIGVPRKTKIVAKERKRINKLLRRLGLGLILIEPERKAGEVEVILDPTPYKPRESKARKQRLLGEFSKRVGDPNLGGSEKRKGIMTAYRQREITVAELLLKHGATKVAEVANKLEAPGAKRILYQNHHGWFARVERGIYELSPRGLSELPDWQRKERR
ncbi:MAG: hypothetical protein ACJAVI_005679 [Candidatus Azotimanducaceae bacterium]|jgi:hypothetical protein